MSFRNFFLNLSLNKKLIGMMLLLSLILVSLSLFLYSQSKRALLSELEKQTADLSRAIQIGIEEVTSIGFTDKMRLYHYLQELKAKGVREISIISNTDEIIASTNPKEVGEQVSLARKERIIKAELGETVYKEGKIYNIVLPVVAGDEHHGYIHLKLDADDFSRLLKMSVIKRISAVSFVFGLGILLAVFLSWIYTKPIRNVVNAAQRVAEGDLTPELVTDRKDEIGELAQSFNFMVQKLKEKHALEEKLREVEHLSGVAQLARDIAHEIRNPLNFISLSIDHLREKYVPGENERKEKFENLITSIKHEIQRLNKLVGDFLDYGRPLNLNLQKVELNNLIQEVMTLVKAKAVKDRVDISTHFEELPMLTVDPELVKTCIFNVILNAFQAMPQGGKLIVSTHASNSKISVIVEDTGLGVSLENVSRVFDPFFSTKSAGLGLGLAMTKRVIEEHGGRVDFQSEEGKGSIITITLPIKNS